jgi:hypothetical protein
MFLSLSFHLGCCCCWDNAVYFGEIIMAQVIARMEFSEPTKVDSRMLLYCSLSRAHSSAAGANNFDFTLSLLNVPADAREAPRILN